MKNNSSFRFSGFSVSILLSILLITMISTYLVYQSNVEKKKIVFENIASKIPNVIESRMKVYEQVLLSGVAMYYSSHNLSRKDWKKFVEELKLDKNFPGIQGVGFSLMIKPEDKQAHIQKIREEGFEFYDIKPKGDRDIYTSIVFLEPFDDRNKRAFGYDMYSEKVRHEAMSNAIETGSYSLSGKVHLLQENGSDVQAGFLAYIPVYHQNMPMTTFKERVDATIGFVYAPFRFKDLITSISLDENKYLDIEIYDGIHEDYENILYDSIHDKKMNLNDDYSYKDVLFIGGKKWLVEINPDEKFFKDTHTFTHVLVLILGLILILFTLIIVYLFNVSDRKKQVYFNDVKSLALRKDLVLKAATIGTWEWTFKDNSLIWDKNMYHIYGIDKSATNENLAEIWKNLIHIDYKSKVFSELFGAKDEKRDLEVDFWVKNTFGEEKYVHSLGIIEYDENNNPIRMIGINIDVTEYETNKQKLLKQNELIENQKLEFESIFEYSKEGMAIIDLEANFLYFNEAYLNITGYSKDELIQKNCLEMTAIEEKEKLEKLFPEIIKIGYLKNYTKTCIVKDRKRVIINMSMVLLPDKKRFLISARDITESKKKEKILNEYVNLIDENVITSSTDLKGIITTASQAFCEISGYEKSELIGKPHNIIRHPDTSKSLYEGMWNKLNNDEIWKGEIKNLKKDGAYYWVNATISPIYNDDGIKIGYTAIREDITDKKIIEKLSITDALTTLYNRRHFNNIFPKFIQSAKRKNEIVCFTLMDIDHFKQYNDTYGHQKGDDTLVAFAKVLKESLHRADDYCFRLGGEEFGVLFKSENVEKAFDFMNLIKTNIENEKIPHEKNSASDYVTVSMGLVCLYANEINDVEGIYKQSDDLLYEAKESGRNMVVCNC